MQHFSFTINGGTYFMYFGFLQSNHVILLGLCLVLAKNILFNLENDFFSQFVVTYMCLNNKPLKIACTFCT